MSTSVFVRKGGPDVGRGRPGGRLLVEGRDFPAVGSDGRAPGGDGDVGADESDAAVAHQGLVAGGVDGVEVVPGLLVERPSGTRRLEVLVHDAVDVELASTE